MSRKILLDKINVPGIKTYEVYRKEGGYASVEKAMKAMTPDEVVEEVKAPVVTKQKYQAPAKPDKSKSFDDLFEDDLPF